MVRDIPENTGIPEKSGEDAEEAPAGQYSFAPVAAQPGSVDHALPAARPSFLRRHWLASMIVGGVIGVVAVSGGTAWAVSAAVGSSSAPVAAAAVPTPTPSHGKTGAKAAARRAAVRGTIAAVNGSTWTITTAAGRTVTVTIDSATKFGTVKAPAAKADFSVGTTVVVAGHRAQNGFIALRVVMPKVKAGNTATPTPSA
ncbi:MAG: DUF5666 domain-containing protein [Lacisediminihabitans sp.]